VTGRAGFSRFSRRAGLAHGVDPPFLLYQIGGDAGRAEHPHHAVGVDAVHPLNASAT
jgi:hypothetical protein